MEKKLIVFMLCMFLFSFVSCQEVGTDGVFSRQGAEYFDSNGIIVNSLVYGMIEIDTTFYIYMTPYEVSGKTLDNATASCRFGMVSPDGSRLLLMTDVLGNFTHISEDDIWIAEIPGTFINEIGTYLYNWDCQSANKGGFYNGELEIVLGGHFLHDSQAMIFLISFNVLLFLFIISIWFADKLPSRDMIDEEGTILQINQLKHLRPVVYSFAWLMVLSMLFLLFNISQEYLSTFMFANFFFAIYQIFFWITIIILPLWFIKIFTDFIKDREFKRMIERGVDIKSTP